MAGVFKPRDSYLLLSARQHARQQIGKGSLGAIPVLAHGAGRRALRI